MAVGCAHTCPRLLGAAGFWRGQHAAWLAHIPTPSALRPSPALILPRPSPHCCCSTAGARPWSASLARRPWATPSGPSEGEGGEGTGAPGLPGLAVHALHRAAICTQAAAPLPPAVGSGRSQPPPCKVPTPAPAAPAHPTPRFMRGQRSLEINPRHPLIRELKAQVGRGWAGWRGWLPCSQLPGCLLLVGLSLGPCSNLAACRLIQRLSWRPPCPPTHPPRPAPRRWHWRAARRPRDRPATLPRCSTRRTLTRQT